MNPIEEETNPSRDSLSVMDIKRNPRKISPVYHSIVIGILCVFLCLAFSVASNRAPQWPRDIPCEWSGVEKIVAIGDLHGAYVYFVEILKGTKLVDDNLSWIGGKTHLVQIGDVMDRGNRPKDIFDLAMKLEKEAEAAGGKVHMLIGNHEEMNLANTAFDREGYVTPQQYVQFIPENYRLKLEKRFEKRSRSKAADSNGNYLEEWKGIIEKLMGESRAAGRMNYFKNLNALYGDWIIGNNVIIKINDIVFVHGGISENFSKWPLKEINDTYRAELDDIRNVILNPGRMPKIPGYDRQLYNEGDGPLWYRAMAQAQKDFADDVDRILANLKANHVVIAHTPNTRVGEEEMKRYGGKVWIIDTGIADYYRPIGGHVAALIIEGDHFHVWYPDSKQ